MACFHTGPCGPSCQGYGGTYPPTNVPWTPPYYPPVVYTVGLDEETLRRVVREELQKLLGRLPNEIADALTKANG